MASIPGQLSPLQVTAAAGLLQNTGLAVSNQLSSVVSQYQSLPLISNFLSVLNNAVAAGLEESTIQALYELGDSTCPALADTIPADYRDQPPFAEPETVVPEEPEPGDPPLVTVQSNFTSILLSTSDGYIDSTSKFAQAFAAAEGYITMANLFIESANNADNYLGPTFSDMNNLITSDVTKVTTLPPLLASDLVELGELIDLGNIPHLGEPAALLQQLNNVAGVVDGTVPCVEIALRVVGLSDQDINDLVTDNRQSLFNPNGLTENQFAKLQQTAYRGLSLVQNDCLITVLDILGVTKPGIEDMTDLLDPEIIFSNSFLVLLFGDQPIYQPNGSINSNLLLPQTAPSGCDELGKIIPPAQAVANKALQFSLQQISGIQNLTLPELAALLS